MAIKKRKKIEETVTNQTEEQVDILPISNNYSALDTLREERGMEKPPKKKAKKPVLKTDDPFEDDEDINDIQLYTTQSYSFDKPENAQLQYIQNVLHKQEPPKEKPLEIKEITHEEEHTAFPLEDSTEDKSTKRKRKKKEKEEKKIAKNRKRREIYRNGIPAQQKLVAAIIGIFLILLAGYSFIVLIYRPMNTVSEDQEVLYDKLIEYADEWDMLSDTEKNELLDIEDDYNSLLSKQRSSLNSYYKEQTGKTLKEIYSELNTQEKEDSDEENVTYLVLLDYINGWENYTENQRMAIIQYRSLYDDIPKALQTKIDAACKEKTTYAFNSIYQEYNSVYTTEIASIPNMVTSYKADAENEYKSELQTLQSQYHEMALNETDYRKKINGMKSSNSKYHDTELNMEINEAKMKQNREVLDFFTQILEQYQNTVAYDAGWENYYSYY